MEKCERVQGVWILLQFIVPLFDMDDVGYYGLEEHAGYIIEISEKQYKRFAVYYFPDHLYSASSFQNHNADSSPSLYVRQKKKKSQQ